MPQPAMRPATPDDIPALLRLYHEADIDEGQGFTPEQAAAHFAFLDRYPSFQLFVAVLDGEVVGTYELLIMDNLAKRGRKSGVVEDVAVDPAHQGNGIGRVMMQHALDQCRDAGCYKMTLSSNVKREGAHRFYDALGFARHGYSFQIVLPAATGGI